MAIFHCQVAIISRGQGKSSVGASAYRAGEKIYNERDGIEHDYTNKKGIVYKEIHTPENAPEWAKDRSKLWNEVERSETRINSRTAREINIALPKELNREQQIELLKGYIKDNFTSRGMIADTVIHDKADGNPHAHVMLTTREVNQEGFTKKNRDWDKRENIEKWREQWATHANKSLEKIGIKGKVDHRSYEEQGLEKVATIHEGHKVRAMESRGITTEVGSYNRQVVEKNKMLELVERQINIYKKQKGELEHGRNEVNGIRNGVIGGKGDSHDIGIKILCGDITRGNEVSSSRTNQSIGTIKESLESEQTGQGRVNKETSREREGEERTYPNSEQSNISVEKRSRGNEEPKLSENRGNEQESELGIKGESRVSQEIDKGHIGISTSSEEHSESIMEGKSETILNSVGSNSRFDSGNSGSISTGNSFSEALKALDGAIKKMEHKEQLLADKESAKLEKEMNKQPKTKSKSKHNYQER